MNCRAIGHCKDRFFLFFRSPINFIHFYLYMCDILLLVSAPHWRSISDFSCWEMWINCHAQGHNPLPWIEVWTKRPFSNQFRGSTNWANGPHSGAYNFPRLYLCAPLLFSLHQSKSNASTRSKCGWVSGAQGYTVNAPVGIKPTTNDLGSLFLLANWSHGLH